MARDAEHVIVGAGCAGLSLALRLGRRSARERGRVVVIDPRREIGGDRIWCSWAGTEHPLPRAVTRRWRRWAVRVGGRTIERSGIDYEQVESEAFARGALEELARAEGVAVELGIAARSIDGSESGVQVATDRGEIRARLAWDARGGGPARDLGGPLDVRWTQHFVGWVVRTERPIFDPGVALLMDFEVPQRRGPHFVYVLPYERDVALVEDTFFDDAPHDDERVYEETIRGWLDRARAGGIEIVRRERGQIPMSSAPIGAREHPRVIPIGLRGGAAKPSTGYAYAFLQRQCARALEIAGDGSIAPPEIPARGAVALSLDRIFLSYLRRHPRAGPAVFGALFERTDPGSLVRFLSETGSIRDHVRVMRGVPSLGVGLEAIRAAPLWARRG